MINGEFYGYNKLLNVDVDWSKDWVIEGQVKQTAYRCGVFITEKTNTTNYEQNRYALLQYSEGNEVVFEGKNNSGVMLIQDKLSNYSNSYNVYYPFKIIKQGNNISTYFNEQLVSSNTDIGTLSIANVGVYSWINVYGYLKDLKIKPL